MRTRDGRPATGDLGEPQELVDERHLSVDGDALDQLEDRVEGGSGGPELVLGDVRELAQEHDLLALGLAQRARVR